jgi:hypothetical protein
VSDEIEVLKLRIKELEGEIERIEKWWKHGEQFYENFHSFSNLFRMGVWWGERPWRK